MRRALDAMIDWQGRSAENIRGYLADNMLAETSRKAFTDLPHTPCPGPRDRGRIACEKVADAGFDILYVDMTPDGCPIATAKLIVPGMEVETMSYYRIGERGVAKLRDLDSPLATFERTGEGQEPVRITPEAMERLGGQTFFDTKLADAIVGPLYPLYREPEAHHAAAAARRRAA